MDSADLLRFCLLGLSSGAIYGLLALGIVMVYRGSGVVNFAGGGFALLSAALYYEMHDNSGVPVVLAVVLAVGASSLLGALIHLGIMRPMRHSSSLSRVIATLGVLVAIQALADKRYSGGLSMAVQHFLPQDSVNVLGTRIDADRLIVAGTGAMLAAGMWALYRFTRFGLATTGVAENRRATAALGWSPDRIAVANWVGGATLSGLAGVLIVPFVGLSTGGLAFTIVPALAAALVGNFASFPATFVGAALLGVISSEAVLFESNSDVPLGTSEAVPFVVILVVLILRGRGLPIRGERSDQLPRVAAGTVRWVRIAIGVGLLLVSLSVYTSDWAAAMVVGGAYALLCLSLVVVTGYCGQLSLAQVAFAGLGALFSSRMADAWGVPFPLAALCGVLITVPIGVLVALPALRVRGVNLAVATLGLGVVVQAMVLSNPDYTGGAFRGTVVPAPSLFGLDLDAATHPARYATFEIVLFVIVGLMVANLRKGRSGRRLLAVRANERAAASLGVGVVGAKVYAFGVGAGIAALGGSLIAFQTSSVDFSQFTQIQSISLLLVATVGGIGSVLGAVFGGVNVVGSIGEQALSAIVDVHGWFAVVGAVLVIIVIMTHPDGIADIAAKRVAELRASARKRLRRRPERVRPPFDFRDDTLIADIDAVPARTLEIEGITVRFGGVLAVDGVCFTVRPGEVVGLVGPNGAGKTTVLDVITGFHRAYEGTVRLDGELLDKRGAVKRSRRGITRSFQNLELFDDLTVADNLRIAAEPHDLASYARDLFVPPRRTLPPAVVAAVHELGLTEHLGALPPELPYAVRRKVAIARAVAARPSVLLLDEPAAGLDANSTAELGLTVRRLADKWGMAVVLIEHDVSMVFTTCDRVVALNFGAVIVDDEPDSVRSHPEFVASYLGEDPSEGPADERPAPPASSGPGQPRVADASSDRSMAR